MTPIRSRLLLATAVASLSLASLAQAQRGGDASRPRDGQGPGMMRRGAGPDRGERGMVAGPRGARGNPAAMFLQLRSELQLTDEQVKRLEALKDAPSVRTNAADLLRARADLLEATQGDGNVTKARAALDRMSALRNERMVAALKQRQDARGVLTAQQKTRLDNFRSARSARGGSRGQRGMRGERGTGERQFRGQPRGPFGPGTPMAPGMNRGPARQGAPVPPL